MGFTYDLILQQQSGKTAEFDGAGHLLSPFYIGPANYAVVTNETKTTIGQKIIAQHTSDLPTQITQQFAQKGYVVQSATVKNVSYTWTRLGTGTWWAFPAVPYDLEECQLTIDWTVQVVLDKELSQSPVPIWVFPLIKFIGGLILGALIAYWIIQAVKDVLTSMTTTTTRVITYNPDGTIKTDETTTNPNPLGSIIVVAGVLGGAALLLYFLAGRSKGSNRG